MSYENLPFVLVDQSTGEQVSVTQEEWERVTQLAKAVDAGDVTLPNSSGSTPSDLGKFFDDLLKTLVDALNKDIKTQAKASADSAEKKLYSPRSALSVAMEEALAQMDGLNKDELKKMAGLGALYQRPDEREKVQKAQLREAGPLDNNDADNASLVETVAQRLEHALSKNTIILR